MSEHKGRPRFFTPSRIRNLTRPPCLITSTVNNKVVRLVATNDLFFHYMIDISTAGGSESNDSTDEVDVCEDCVMVHQIRNCDGSTGSSFEFCSYHPDSDCKPEEWELLEETRKILGTSRHVPKNVKYKHIEGCCYSDSPECKIQVSGEKLAGSMYIKNCSGQYVNARGQMLERSGQQASEQEARLAANCRWIYRRDIVLASLPADHPIRTMIRMNQGETVLVSLELPRV